MRRRVEPHEGPFDQLSNPRHEQRQREEEEQDRADLDLVLGVDADEAPQPGARQKEGCERRDSPAAMAYGRRVVPLPPPASTIGRDARGECTA